MVLLVFLAIVWAAVGVYWLKTRVPTPSLAMGGLGRRSSSSLVGSLGSLGSLSPRRSSNVVSMKGLGSPAFGGQPAGQLQGVREHTVRGQIVGGQGLRGVSSGPTPQRAHPVGHPGHSLTDPARRASAGAGAGNRPNVNSEQARVRRRNVLVALCSVAALTLLGVVAVGGSTLVALHLLTDAALLGFVLLLVQYQREIELDRTQNLPVYAEPRPTPHHLAATGTGGPRH